MFVFKFLYGHVPNEIFNVGLECLFKPHLEADEDPNTYLLVEIVKLSIIYSLIVSYIFIH